MNHQRDFTVQFAPAHPRAFPEAERLPVTVPTHLRTTHGRPAGDPQPGDRGRARCLKSASEIRPCPSELGRDESSRRCHRPHS